MNNSIFVEGSSSEPLQKRKRMGSAQADNEFEPSTDVLDPPLAIRDSEYYLEGDGADCVILVENTLFKVHRFILSKDSSAFQNMFTMPAGQSHDGRALGREGSSDANPVILSEKVDHFRALLWVLYALPRDLQKHQGSSGDLDLLIKLAIITHKYHFTTTEAWTLDAICNVVSDRACLAGTWYTSEELLPLLDVAMLCDHSRLLEILVSNWEPRLLCGTLPPIPAILAADKYQLKSLQGAAYYACVLEMDKSSSALTWFSDERLSRDQLTRLMSGHWSLVKYWEHMRECPTSFPRFEGCTYHTQGCLTTWGTRWNKLGRSEKMLRYRTVDSLGRLQCLHGQLAADEVLKQSLTPGCRTSALSKLSDQITALQILLVDFFQDRTQPFPSPSDSI